MNLDTFSALFKNYRLAANGVLQIGARGGRESEVYSRAGIAGVVWLDDDPALSTELHTIAAHSGGRVIPPPVDLARNDWLDFHLEQQRLSAPNVLRIDLDAPASRALAACPHTLTSVEYVVVSTAQDDVDLCAQLLTGFSHARSIRENGRVHSLYIRSRVRFKIIVAAYQCMQWLPRCLDSIAEQTDSAFDVCVIDDCSPDRDQARFIREYCSAKGGWNEAASSGWLSIINYQQLGAMYNQVHAARKMNPNPEDIIVFVDGDDRLAHANVLARVRSFYNDGTLLTYGSFRSEPPSNTTRPAVPYPQDVIANSAYRAYGVLHFNHLRTLKYKLLAQLENSDFKDARGEWFNSCTDAAIMIPCMELAEGKIKCIPEVLYVYNSTNPLSDWRRQPEQVDADHWYILKTLPKKVPQWR